MNIYLLSQHNIGLGHLNRTALLAGALKNLPGASVFHLSCGVPTEIIPASPDVILVKLPPLIVNDLSHPDLTPLETGRTKEDIEKERTDIIMNLFRKKPPGLFLTEFFPFSPHRLDGTVIPLLEFVKKQFPDCGIICSVRDIPLCHGEKLTRQKTRYITSLLNAFYDLVLVHSDYHILKVNDIRGYRTFKTLCPVIYTGYITKPIRQPRVGRSNSDSAKILVTTGGGLDGYRIIRLALGVARRNPEYHFDLVCGPLMEVTQREDLSLLSQGLKNVQVFPYLRELKKAIPGYDLLICAGGYNTVIEALINRKRCISIPRISSYEQRKRADIFSKRNLLWTPTENRLTVKRLAALIEKVLASPSLVSCPIETDGLRKSLSAIQARFPGQFFS